MLSQHIDAANARPKNCKFIHYTLDKCVIPPRPLVVFVACVILPRPLIVFRRVAVSTNAISYRIIMPVCKFASIVESTCL